MSRTAVACFVVAVVATAACASRGSRSTVATPAATAPPTAAAGPATPTAYLLRGVPGLVPAGTQAGYLLDPNSETCLLIYAGQPYGEVGVLRAGGRSDQRSVNVPVAAPVDCSVLAANLEGSAVLIPWLAQRPR